MLSFSKSIVLLALALSTSALTTNQVRGNHHRHLARLSSPVVPLAAEEPVIVARDISAQPPAIVRRSRARRDNGRCKVASSSSSVTSSTTATSTSSDPDNVSPTISSTITSTTSSDTSPGTSSVTSSTISTTTSSTTPTTTSADTSPGTSSVTSTTTSSTTSADTSVTTSTDTSSSTSAGTSSTTSESSAAATTSTTSTTDPAATTTAVPINNAPQPTTTTTDAPTPTDTAPPVSGPAYMTGTQSGDATYYGTGLGACGITNYDTDHIIAVSKLLFDTYPGYAGQGSNPNNNPICGKQIIASYNGNSVTVTVTDRCEACSITSLDFSPSAFSILADQALGRLHGMTWVWK